MGQRQQINTIAVKEPKYNCGVAQAVQGWKLTTLPGSQIGFYQLKPEQAVFLIEGLS